MAMTIRRAGSIAEINVTPMADVMIVLLIIFMVTVPLIANGPVERLPDASQARPHEQGPIKVSMTDDARLFLSGVPIADSRELSEKLRAALASARVRLVYVEADARLPYALVAQLLTRCRESGAEEVALIAAPSAAR